MIRKEAESRVGRETEVSGGRGMKKQNVGKKGKKQGAGRDKAQKREP